MSFNIKKIKRKSNGSYSTPRLCCIILWAFSILIFRLYRYTCIDYLTIWFTEQKRLKNPNRSLNELTLGSCIGLVEWIRISRSFEITAGLSSERERALLFASPSLSSIHYPLRLPQLPLSDTPSKARWLLTSRHFKTLNELLQLSTSFQIAFPPSHPHFLKHLLDHPDEGNPNSPLHVIFFATSMNLSPQLLKAVLDSFTHSLLRIHFCINCSRCLLSSRVFVSR